MRRGQNRDEAAVGVFKNEAPRVRVEVLDPEWRGARLTPGPTSMGTAA